MGVMGAIPARCMGTRDGQVGVEGWLWEWENLVDDWEDE